MLAGEVGAWAVIKWSLACWSFCILVAHVTLILWVLTHVDIGGRALISLIPEQFLGLEAGGYSATVMQSCSAGWGGHSRTPQGRDLHTQDPEA